MVFCFLLIPVLPICPLDALLFSFNPLLMVLADVPAVASLGALVLILKLFCLSLLIEITKSIVGHFKAVLRGVFVIKTSVFVVIAFDRTHCHKMLIFSSIVNVSWLYSLIPNYTHLPLIAYLLLLISYLLSFAAYRLQNDYYSIFAYSLSSNIKKLTKPIHPISFFMGFCIL